MYQGKVRVRAVGLLIENDQLLLLNHKGLGPDGYLWSPPGGGVDFGMNIEETLKKEFLEETNLNISVSKFLFVNEFLDKKHHAVELFFEVKRISGNIQLGTDPELTCQILTEIGFFSIEQLKRLPTSSVHNVLSKIDSLDDMLKLSGYYKFALF